jgi:hypothetical protein
MINLPLPCKKCTGYGDGHFLTCPTLRYRRVPDDKPSQD